MRWLHVPRNLLRALADALPKLQAEEALAMINRVALGTGSLERGEAEEALEALRQRAEVGRARKISRSAAIAEMQKIGVRIVRGG